MFSYNRKVVRSAYLVLILLVAFVTIAVLLTACTPEHHARSYQEATYNAHYQEYHYQDPTGQWLYYYVLFSSFNGNSTTYYYTSPTPLNSLRDVPFTKANDGKVPVDVEQAETKGELISRGDLDKSEEPVDVEKDVAQQEVVWEEYQETQGKLDAENEATENPAPESETTSTDSGSSSSDSGSSDSGGSE